MATMNCECGETVTGEDNHLLEAYRQHQESHLPSTQAEWSIAYQNMQQWKEKPLGNRTR